jgi:hypothetical protein
MECEGCVAGCFERSLLDLDSLVIKLHSKIEDRLTELMGETYGWSAAVGLKVPTLDEIEKGDEACHVIEGDEGNCGIGNVDFPPFNPPGPSTPSPTWPPSPPGPGGVPVEPTFPSLPVDPYPGAGGEGYWTVFARCEPAHFQIVTSEAPEMAGHLIRTGYTAIFGGPGTTQEECEQWIIENWAEWVRVWCGGGTPKPPKPPGPPVAQPVPNPPPGPGQPPPQPGACPAPCPPPDINVHVHVPPVVPVVNVPPCPPAPACPQLPPINCGDGDDTFFVNLPVGPPANQPNPTAPPAHPPGNWWVLAKCYDRAWQIYVEQLDSTQVVAPNVHRVGSYEKQEQAVEVHKWLDQNPKYLDDRFGQCTPLPPANPGRVQLPQLDGLDWNNPLICQALSQLGQDVDTSDDHYLSKVLGLRTANGSPTTPTWVAALRAGPFGALGEAFQAFITDSVDALWSVIRQSPSVGGCKSSKIILPLVIKAVLSSAQKWLGVDLDEIKQPFDYWQAHECPTDLPSTADVDNMRRAGVIDRETWLCWIKANGMLPDPAEKNYQAGHPLPSFREAFAAYYRNRISFEEYHFLKRANGLQDIDLSNLVQTCMENTPSPSDLVQFMTRDAADEKNIDWKSSDKEFEDKYVGILKQWGEGGFVSKEEMKYHFRSHWRLPSPQQLYEMEHRLREGRVSDELVVDRPRVLSALGQNDVHPEWRERLAAISYSPMTRTDVHRAFETGSMVELEAIEAVRDLGYDLKSATSLVNFWKRLRAKRIHSERAIRMFVRGTISEEECVKLLENLGYSASDIAGGIEAGRLEVRAKRRTSCYRHVKARLFRGEIDTSQAIGEAIRIGAETGLADEMVRGWECEFKSKTKAPTFAQLCKMYKNGFITEEEYLLRLNRLGYSMEDAVRVANSCSDLPHYPVPEPGKPAKAIPLKDRAGRKQKASPKPP